MSHLRRALALPAASFVTHSGRSRLNDRPSCLHCVAAMNRQAERPLTFPSWAELRAKVLSGATLSSDESLALLDLAAACELYWIRENEEADTAPVSPGFADGETDMFPHIRAKQLLNNAHDVLVANLHRFTSMCMCEVEDEIGSVTWQPCPENLCDRTNHRHV